MTKDDAQLYSPAIMLIAHLRRKGQTQGYYEHAVEMALHGLQHNSPGRYRRDGWMEVGSYAVGSLNW